MTSEVISAIEQKLNIHVTSEDPLNDIHRALEHSDEVKVRFTDPLLIWINNISWKIPNPRQVVSLFMNQLKD